MITFELQTPVLYLSETKHLAIDDVIKIKIVLYPSELQQNLQAITLFLLASNRYAT